MRAYSEIIASFRRGGPFPIEADYIFETETKLKEFYSSPEENAILHKGLLKMTEMVIKHYIGSLERRLTMS